MISIITNITYERKKKIMNNIFHLYAIQINLILTITLLLFYQLEFDFQFNNQIDEINFLFQDECLRRHSS